MPVELAAEGAITMTEPNPSLYRELSQPFPTIEAAQAALDAFRLELAELRKKHKIPDIAIVTQFDYFTAGQEWASGVLSFSYGNQMGTEAMYAYAYGQAVRDRQARIGELLKGILLEQPKAK